MNLPAATLPTPAAQVPLSSVRSAQVRQVPDPKALAKVRTWYLNDASEVRPCKRIAGGESSERVVPVSAAGW